MNIQQAYETGVQIAAGYKVGDRFVGAWGEAERLGLAGEAKTFFHPRLPR